jgi:hypothetical protein
MGIIHIALLSEKDELNKKVIEALKSRVRWIASTNASTGIKRSGCFLPSSIIATSAMLLEDRTGHRTGIILNGEKIIRNVCFRMTQDRPAGSFFV